MSVLPTRLSRLILPGQVPEPLRDAAGSLATTLDKIYYQNYQAQRTSTTGDFYAQLELVAFDM